MNRTMTGPLDPDQGSLSGKIRSQFFYKALDSVATAPLRADQRLTDRFWKLLNPRSSNYDRVAAAVNVFDGLAPGVAGRWSRRLLDYGQLPLATAPLATAPPATAAGFRNGAQGDRSRRGELHAYGSGATLFLLQGTGRALILKVYRRTLGRSSAGLISLARYFRQKYTTVCSWYGSGPINILPSWYFILNAPLLATPAVGMLQPYIDVEMKDLFLDFSTSQLLGMLEEDPGLAAQLRFFCKQSLAVAEREGRCLDIVGRDNVTLLRTPVSEATASGEHVLTILDYGVFDLAEKRVAAPKAYDHVMWRLNRLENLLKEIDM